MFREDLFQAIVDDLADDAARLVYADALTEAGDERGEFIVLQVDRAAGRGSPARSDLERTKFYDSGKNVAYASPLDRIAQRIDVERGFPSFIMLLEKGLKDVLDAPEWGTVRNIVYAERAPIQAMTRLLESGIVRNLDGVSSLSPKLLAKLKAPSFAWSNVSFVNDRLSPEQLGRFPNLRHVGLVTRTDWQRDEQPPLVDDFFAACPNLVSATIDLPVGDYPARARIFDANPKLEALTFPRGSPIKGWSGLKVSTLRVLCRFEDIMTWLDVVPSLTTFEAFQSKPDWSVITRPLEEHPQLDTLGITGLFGRLTVTRADDGYVLTSMHNANAMRSSEHLLKNAPALKRAGIARLLVHPAPRHWHEPLADAELAKLRKAWGDALSVIPSV